MKRLLQVALCLVFLMMPSACSPIGAEQNEEVHVVNTARVTPQPEETEPDVANSVTVNGRTFSIEEINAGIKDTFNNRMYDTEAYDYSNDDRDIVRNNLIVNKKLILHKDVEYDLYFDPENVGYSFPEMTVYIVINNMLYPSSTEENPQVYAFGIRITEWGLQSDFILESFGPKKETYEFYKDVTYLGRYTMRIDEIIKPQYEQMDSEWVESTKRNIRMYMDENMDEILESGNYHVYVKKFFKGDTDSIIFFEHENGNIYRAYYYFVHYSAEGSADLNHLELVEYDESESFKKYYEKIKSDPAVSLEYSVKKQ